MELSLIYRSGIPLTEGLLVMIDSEDSHTRTSLLKQLFQNAEQGMSVHSSMAETALFPDYVLHMVELGEYTGRLDDVFLELSHYCQRRVNMGQAIKNAVLYPSVLLLGMIGVLIVLIVKVLPIFNNVFKQLGGSLSPFAAYLLNFGYLLSANWRTIVIALAVAAILCVILFLVPGWRLFVAEMSWKLFSKTKTGKKILAARFSSAISTVITGGINTDRALDMVQPFFVDTAVEEPVKRALVQMSSGASFSDSVSSTGLLNPMYVKMLTMAARTGNTDIVMAEIAERSEADMYAALDKLVGTIEPAMVALMSLVVGIILASVLLPLLSIMSIIWF